MNFSRRSVYKKVGICPYCGGAVWPADYTDRFGKEGYCSFFCAYMASGYEDEEDEMKGVDDFGE